MKPITREDFSELVQRDEEPCVSMFLPLERGGAQKKQNQIRLKNSLREANKRLEEVGLRSNEAEDFLEPAQQLLEDSHFWKNDSDGLAVFVGPDFFRYYRVPSRFHEIVVVSNRYHIKPLLPLVTNDGKFFVLALSKKNVRLLQCTHYSHREVPIPDAPHSYDEELEGEVREQHLQHHTGQPGSGRNGIFHGGGDVPDKASEKRKAALYVKHVQHGVKKMIGSDHAPLVLAGLEEMRSMYREANSYQNLMEDAIDDNPENLSSEELHEQGWDLVRPHFEENQRQAIEAYQGLSEKERTSNDIEEILSKAYQGMVELLLADLDHEVWGTFDPETGDVETHEEEQSGDEDLLDLAAIYSLMHGARVFGLEAENMPEGNRLAAVYRY